jgi:hypothetical protein
MRDKRESGGLGKRTPESARTIRELVLALDTARKASNIPLKEIAERAGYPETVITRALGQGRSNSPVRPPVFIAIIEALGIEDVEPWRAALQRVNDVSGQHIFVSGENSGTITVNQIGLKEPGTSSSSADLASQRQTFFFDFLSQALSQANSTFRFSMVFTAAGAVILLVGAALALAMAGTSNGTYAPLVASLSGVIITTCGGAFALHASRARKHLTDQAIVIQENIQSDHTLQQALKLIDRVDDADLRDRLKSITAVRVLGLSPEPIDLTEHLPPHKSD